MAMKRISVNLKPRELSLEDWQRLIRAQMAMDEKFTVRNIGDHPVFSTFNVRNLKTGNIYRVEVRGELSGINYCSCPDFSINTLGTCKHIEHVLTKLRRNQRTRNLLKAGYTPDHSSVTVRYGIGRTVAFCFGRNADKSLKALVSRFYENGILTPWGFDHFDEFVNGAKKLRDEVHCHDDAMTYIAGVRDENARKERIKKILPQGMKDAIFNHLLKTNLYPYQKEGALFALNAGRCLIADEMGLGKTVQAIAAAELMARCYGIEKVLIICPTSLKHQWKTEIDKFTKRDVHVIQGTHVIRQPQYTQKSFYKIANYNVIHSDFRSISEWSPDLIILDEAQRIKNWNTRLAKTVKKLYSPYAMVLTGTPLENRLEELHSIVEFIDRYRLGPLFRFLHNHQITDDCGKVTGYRSLNELGKSLEPVLIRRKRQEVLSQMPGRTEKNYFVPLTPEQGDVHEENRMAVAHIVTKWRRHKFLSEIDKQRLMMALQNMRMVSDDLYLVDHKKERGNKINELEIQLEELLEYKDTKIVIFSQWIRMFELVKKMLDVHGWKYVWLHGGVPGPKRGELISQFNNDSDCRLFLSTEAGGVGLNLQSAAVVINLDLPWNPAVLEQRIGRVHRLGQKETVRVINIIAENSIEHGMLSLLKFKKSLFAGVLDGGEDKVFMGTSRFNQFMKTVETAAEGIGDAKISKAEQDEVLQDAITSREIISEKKEQEPETSAQIPSNSVTSAGEFLHIGAALLEQLSRQFAGERNNINTIIHKDDKTGKSVLQIPLPDNEIMKRLLKAGNAFLNIMQGAGD